MAHRLWALSLILNARMQYVPDEYKDVVPDRVPTDCKYAVICAKMQGLGVRVEGLGRFRV